MFRHPGKTQWRRKGNFWRDSRSRVVNFLSDGLIIPRITFIHDEDGTDVTLHVSQFYLPKISSYFVQAFAANPLFEMHYNAVSFRLAGDDAEKLIAIFRKINLAFHCIEFSPELLHEITQISDYLQGRIVAAEHVIKKQDINNNWLVNPNRAQSLKLITLFKKASSQKPLIVRKIKECFKDGENPNQCDSTDNTPMDVLFNRKDLSEEEFKWGVSWLLAFKWVVERACWGEFSTLEKHARFAPAKMHWFNEVIGLQIYAPVRASTMKVQSCATANRILTAITYENKIIRTEIKNTAALSAEESQDLYALFAETFEVDPDKRDQLHLEDIFQEDFVGDNKHVEIIYDCERIIGFNLYETMTLENYPDHLVLNCVDSVMHPAYRRSGLVTMLVFRMAFLLQMLCPENIVSLFCVAIHANSGTLFNNLNMLYHPQYGDHDQFVQAILGSKVSYFRDNVECHIPQRIRVKESNPSYAGEHILKAFFRNEMLGGNKDNQCKGVPIVLFMGYQTYKQLCDFYAGKFYFGAHLRDLAAEIVRSGYQFHPICMGKSKTVALCDVVKLFWCNEKNATSHVLTLEPHENIRCGL